MNIDKLKNTINNNNDLKKIVFFNYIKDDLLELLKDNQILTVDNGTNTINFLNYESYKLSYDKTIEESIIEFESLMPLYKEYSKEINEILNKNIEKFKVHLINLEEKLKLKYFHYKHLKLSLSKDNFNKKELTLNILLDNNNYISHIPINEFWTYIEDKYDDTLDRFARDKLKPKVIAQLEIIEDMSNYKVSISEIQTKSIEIITMAWEKDKISFPIKILSDKQCFDNAIYESTNYLKREKYEKYLKRFYVKYPFVTVDNPGYNYDLEQGILDINYDLNKFDNIEKLYNDIKKYEKECNILKTTSEENDMHDYKFMNKCFIHKVDSKEIDGDKYNIYKYSCGRKKNVMFFKNEVKISRTKYHEVALLLGYNKKIVIDDRGYNDWEALSKKHLTEEQIDKYKEKLDWKFISKYHKLTDEMLIKYYQYIDWEIVLKERKIKRTVLEKLAPLIGWPIISEFANMKESFLMDHIYDLDIEKVLKNPCCKFAQDIINTLINSK